jgi:hypothetical protein
MMAKPNRLNGEKSPVIRDDQGRFVKGSGSPSPGRPSLAADLPYLEGLKVAVTAEKVATVLERLYEDAMKGNIHAARIFLSYALGNPAQHVELDATVTNAQVTVYLPMLPELDTEAEGTGGYLSDELE